VTAYNPGVLLPTEENQLRQRACTTVSPPPAGVSLEVATWLTMTFGLPNRVVYCCTSMKGSCVSWDASSINLPSFVGERARRQDCSGFDDSGACQSCHFGGEQARWTFRDHSRTGSRAQSVVYLARDPHLQRQVAIKTLHFARADPQQNRQLLDEARMVSQLRHPNIVPIFEAAESRVISISSSSMCRARTLPNTCRSVVG
jgi:hypothetical protein